MSYGSAQPLVSRIQRSSITLHDKLVKTRVAGGGQRKPCIGSWLMLPGHSLARMIGSMEYDVSISLISPSVFHQWYQ